MKVKDSIASYVEDNWIEECCFLFIYVHAYLFAIDNKKYTSLLKTRNDKNNVSDVKYTTAYTKLPYRGKFRWGKVTRFFASDENFPRRKISPT